MKLLLISATRFILCWKHSFLKTLSLYKRWTYPSAGWTLGVNYKKGSSMPAPSLFTRPLTISPPIEKPPYIGHPLIPAVRSIHACKEEGKKGKERKEKKEGIATLVTRLARSHKVSQGRETTPRGQVTKLNSNIIK